MTTMKMVGQKMTMPRMNRRKFIIGATATVAAASLPAAALQDTATEQRLELIGGYYGLGIGDTVEWKPDTYRICELTKKGTTVLELVG